MHRFFVSPDQITDDHIWIMGEAVHHIRRVLRMHEGDEVLLCDGLGWDYRCTLSTLLKDRIRGEIQNRERSPNEPALQITLFQGLPKKDKMDLVVQKTVELGIFRIVPVITAHTVVHLDEGQKQKKTVRWQKIAQSAAEQCGRGIIPEVLPPCSLQTASLLAQQLDAAFVPYELEREYTLKQALQTADGRSLGIFIGPEGGFAPEEVDHLKCCGFSCVTLGSRILRTETAGFTALILSLYERGDL